MTKITYNREEMLALRHRAPATVPIEIPEQLRYSNPKYPNFFDASCKPYDTKYRFNEDQDPGGEGITVSSETNLIRVR